MSFRKNMIQAVEHLQRRFYDRSPKTWQVVSDPSALDDPMLLPCEIRYHLAIHPMRYRAMKDFLARGGGIAYTRDYSIPPDVVSAVHRIAQTQQGALFPWLEDLLLRSCKPVWSDADAEEAEQFGIRLDDELGQILSHQRKRFSISMLRATQADVTEDDRALIEGLRQDLQSLHAAEMAYHISLAMQQHSRAPVVLSLLTFLFFAPIAHALNIVWLGFGTVFMILAVSLFCESRLLYRAYQYGNAHWQLKRLLLVRAPFGLAVLILSSFVQPLIQLNTLLFAGLLFALALMLFPLRSFFGHALDAKRRYQLLARQGRGSDVDRFGWLAIFDGPAWWIRPLHYGLPFVYLPVFFLFFPQLLSNGWVLGALAISSGWVYYGLSRFWRSVLGWRFERRIHRLMMQTIIAPTSFI